MRYQSISIDWTSSGPRLYYSQLLGEREDFGEQYYSNGFAYLPASLSKEEVTTKFIDRLLSELQEDGTRISKQIGQLKGLRPASEIKPPAHAPYFYYQDGQWFGYSNSVGGSPARFGELVCDVDGYWKFFPVPATGYFPDFIMKAVLDKLGELNAVWDKQIESDPAIAAHSNLEDALEAAFWRFDARRSGYADWKVSPQSVRDAFKGEVRSLLADYTAGINSSYFVDNDSRVAAMMEAAARSENARQARNDSVVAKAEDIVRSQVRSFSKLEKPTYEQLIEKENRDLKAANLSLSNRVSALESLVNQHGLSGYYTIGRGTDKPADSSTTHSSVQLLIGKNHVDP